ncbi:MAG TPA: DUF1801 domain-containing protein [Vicinamibacterales bacterium]|nr:DUF1801 domain-containing protein [Vicinamibacterales bacterium]
MPPDTAARQLAAFMAKYTPSIAKEGRAALARMRKLVPGAVEMVYDNWNGLVVGFGPTERASEAVVSILMLPNHVTLCFIQDAPALPDPHRLLKGSGNVVRHLRLGSARDLEKPAVRDLVKAAVARSDVPFAPRRRRKLVIKSISKKQRPRRPI